MKRLEVIWTRPNFAKNYASFTESVRELMNQMDSTMEPDSGGQRFDGLLKYLRITELTQF
jgi:hypothetical protein